ncbi:hypothetical protein LIER_38918 [Lithospermum erythrorhizon]|uniref:DUF4283 domain-containing protein n=1 Tax=Lithospermum erythrorhizon TaxID=34254 RepID=A0AAV3Q7H1_LITER
MTINREKTSIDRSEASLDRNRLHLLRRPYGVQQSQLTPKILYSDVVKAQDLQSQTSIDLHNRDIQHLKSTTLYQGKPSVVFPISEKQALVEKLKYVLVGKFTHGHPSMGIIKKFFLSLKLKDSCNSTICDKKYIFIECVCEDDFNRIWLKLKWVIEGYVMRVFKWSPDFSPLKESSIAPVWIRVVGLPLYLFDEMSLRSISNSIGRPIRVDPRNVNRTMLNSARICVELDVSKPLLEDILIIFEDEFSKVVLDRLWVKVFYDVLPLFCDFCFHIGHGMDGYKRRWEEVRLGKAAAQGQEVSFLAPQVFDKISQQGNSTNVIQIEQLSNGSEDYRPAELLKCLKKGCSTATVAAGKIVQSHEEHKSNGHQLLKHATFIEYEGQVVDNNGTTSATLKTTTEPDEEQIGGAVIVGEQLTQMGRLRDL